ncbi:MAG: type IX secretion system membrane protein PorP/SprF [Croceivirga sp.]
MKETKNFLHLPLLIMAVIVINVNAQQDPTYTLYNYNLNVINPAFAGSGENSLLTANVRSQWTGVEGGPEIQSLSFSTPMGNRVGIGLSFVNSKVFVLSETDMYIDFSYKVPLARFTDLYFGLKAGASNINVDLNSLNITNDPLFTENVSRFNPNIGAGAMIKGRRFYASISAPALLNTRRFERSANVVTNASDRIHMFIGGGYTLLFENSVEFTPSVMARWVAGAPFSIDLTGTFDFNEKVELGLSHRLQESISGILFLKMADWVSIGYAYEYATTEVQQLSSGTHEVMMRFNW